MLSLENLAGVQNDLFLLFFDYQSTYRPDVMTYTIIPNKYITLGVIPTTVTPTTILVSNVSIFLIILSSLSGDMCQLTVTLHRGKGRKW